jgi:DNA topoisomerase VI subunit B
MTKPTLTRTTFVTNRQHEFFTEKELTMQFGAPKALWPLVTVKELIDNSLDATEATDVAPEIAIVLEPDSVTVTDNGPGLKASTIASAIDYNVRVSDKRHYISPSRGQLGNALKCVFPVAFVATGKKSIVDITACGIHHLIEVDIDHIAQEPRIQHIQTPSVQNGSTITVHWPQIACCEIRHPNSELYRGPVEQVLPELVRDFSAVNPHASFTVTAGGRKRTFKASNPGWRKWRTNDPTSAHWYTKAELRELIVAYIAKEEKEKLPRKTLRDFVGEFDGLARPQYRKVVLEQARLAGMYVCDLKADVDGDMVLVGQLLAAMQSVSKPVKPERLGVVGKNHLRDALVAWGADGEVEYARDPAIGDDGLPYVVEVAFGITHEDQPRKLVCALNHSILFNVPSQNLYSILRDRWIESCDPIAIVVHQAHPRFAFTGHGKGAL